MKKKVFIGIHEIGNVIKLYEDALKKNGYIVDSYILYRNPFYLRNAYKYALDKYALDKYVFIRSKLLKTLLKAINNLYWFVKIMFKYDIYIYTWIDTLLPFKLDFFILKALGKKVIVFNCGDDVRYRPMQYRLYKEALGAYYQVKDPVVSFYKSYKHQKLEEYSKVTILTGRDQATFLGKTAYIYNFPMSMKILSPKMTNHTPLIIHAPTDREFKGTKYVLKAINILRKENINFEFELIEKNSNEYVLKRLKEADILIDQPCYSVGTLGKEGLASGCVVIGGNRPEIEYMGGNSPVIQFIPDAVDLADKLRILILDAEKRQAIMNECYNYWKNHYSYEAFGIWFNKLLLGTAPKLKPLKDQQKLIYKYAENNLQRFLIKFFW